MNEHSPDPDAELVRKARSGDDSAFERLFRNHASRVLAIATRIVGDADEAGDVLQEVFVKVHRRLGHFRFKSTFSLWIRRIAINESLNWAARRRPNTISLVEDRRIAPAAQTEESPALALLQALPPKLRAVAVLRHLQDMTHEEIADVLECPVATCRSRLFAANRLMQETLQRMRAAR